MLFCKYIKAVRFSVTFLLFTFSVFITATVTRADGHLTPVVGVVIAVTANSELLLDKVTSPLELGETVLVKQWSLDISPEQLELLTFGREVHCRVVSQTEEYLIGDCAVRFISIDTASDQSFRGNLINTWNLRVIAREYKIGTEKCSEEDRNLPPLIRHGLRFFTSLEN